MVVLIIGGSGSGKSVFAEEYTIKLSENAKKYYLATMKVQDKEAQKKVLRHQKLREGKGFSTIEQPQDLQEAVEKMGEDSAGTSVVLLECISNLVANEMFRGGQMQDYERVKEKIFAGISQLEKRTKDLIIVTNNVFEDGRIYEEATTDYLRTMGGINQKLARMADQIIEVVAGIAIIIKEGK